MLRASIVAEFRRRKISISELARQSGISRPNLSEYLAGKTDLRGDSVARLLAALSLVVKRRGRS